MHRHRVQHTILSGPSMVQKRRSFVPSRRRPLLLLLFFFSSTMPGTNYYSFLEEERERDGGTLLLLLIPYLSLFSAVSEAANAGFIVVSSVVVVISRGDALLLEERRAVLAAMMVMIGERDGEGKNDWHGNTQHYYRHQPRFPLSGSPNEKKILSLCTGLSPFSHSGDCGCGSREFLLSPVCQELWTETWRLSLLSSSLHSLPSHFLLLLRTANGPADPR